MTNTTSNRCTAVGIAALTCSLVLSACGSGWAPAFNSSSSSSNTVKLRIIDRDPAPYEPTAAPLDELRITFNKNIDPASVALALPFHGSPSIRMFEEPPIEDGMGDYTNDMHRQLIGRISTEGVTVTLHLRSPLRLLQTYYIRFVDGAIKTTGGQSFSGDAEDWEFTVDDGKLQPEALVSFLQPMGGIRYLEDRSSALIIEGRDVLGNFVIGLSRAPADGDYGIPTILRKTNKDDETNQNGLTVSQENSKLMSVAWQEGKPFEHTNSVSQLVEEPKGDLWVVSSVDGGKVFSGGEQIDLAVSPSANTSAIRDKVSWPVQLDYNDAGDTVTAWWAFRDVNPSATTALFQYDDFGVYTAVRDAAGWQTAVPIATPPAGSAFGWPFLAREPGNARIFAIWAEASAPEDFFNDAQSKPQEVLTRYWLGTYDRALGWISRPITNTPPNLPRPSDFVISGNGRGVIFAPSNGAGPRAFVIDLDLADMLHESKHVHPGGEVLDNPSGAFNLPSKLKFLNSIRAVVDRTIPRALPQSSAVPGGDQTVLVQWKSLGGRIFINEFDVNTNAWQDAVCVIDEGLNSQIVQTPRLRIDQTGAITMAWVVKKTDANGMFLEQTGRAARSRALDPLDPDNTGIKGLVNNTFTLTDASNGTCTVSLQLDIHPPTGRILYGWNYKDCTVTQFLASGIRRFE